MYICIYLYTQEYTSVYICICECKLYAYQLQGLIIVSNIHIYTPLSRYITYFETSHGYSRRSLSFRVG